jgi:prevent-host-death family protein
MASVVPPPSPRGARPRGPRPPPARPSGCLPGRRAPYNVEREHGRVVITRHGRPAAVVLSIDDLESLEETLEVLGNSALMADIREALTNPGDAVVMTKEEALRTATGR